MRADHFEYIMEIVGSLKIPSNCKILIGENYLDEFLIVADHYESFKKCCHHLRNRCAFSKSFCGENIDFIKMIYFFNYVFNEEGDTEEIKICVSTNISKDLINNIIDEWGITKDEVE